MLLATQEAEIRRITVWSQPRQIVHKTLSGKKKIYHKEKGLVEWLKVEALSSNSSTTKKNGSNLHVHKLMDGQSKHGTYTQWNTI
jgi:hypothetical protein